jgi:nitroreductase
MFEGLVGQAVLAPSSHNTQPWLFEQAGEAIRLRADRTRALPVNDPDDRELTISCGCALMNLRVAAAAQGMGLAVTVPERPQDEDLLADMVPAGEGDAALAALAPAIASRRTHRKRFADRPVPAQVTQAMAEAAQAEGAWLDVLTETGRREAAAALVAEGDAVQWADPSWRRELAAWMHPRVRGDGLALPWLAVPVAKVVVRTFDMGNGVGAKDHELAEASPVLAVLGTAGDSRADWLSAGQALERVLLAATAQGLQASYLNQPVQVARLRPKLQHLCRPAGLPQTLLRLGYPDEALPPSPRRELAEVVAA